MTEPTIEQHNLTAEADHSVHCSCGFKASGTAWGREMATRVASAHRASPHAPTVDLLAFVTGRTVLVP